MVKNMFIRFIVVTMMLLATAFVMPGFEIEKFVSLILAAMIIISFDFIIEALTDGHLSMAGRVILGFLLALLVLYFLQFFIMGYRAGGMTILLVSFTIGMVNGIIPQTA